MAFWSFLVLLGRQCGLLGRRIDQRWKRKFCLHRRSLSLGLLACLAWGIVMAGAAWSQPSANGAGARDTAPVLLNGVPVIELSRSTELTAEERAETIAQRLSNFIEGQGAAGVAPEIQVEQRNGATTLVLNGNQLLTITEGDTSSGQDPDAQAQEWASRLQAQLELAIAEQRPDFWRERGVIALGILVLSVSFHVGLTLLVKGARQWLNHQLAVDVAEATPPRLLNVAFRAVKVVMLVSLWLGALSYAAELFPLTRRLSYELRQQLVTTITAPIIPLADGYSVIQFGLLVILLVALIIGAGILTELLKSRFLNALGIERGVQEAIAVLFKYCFIVISAIVLLQLWGIDLSSLTILASAFGVGIGFGFQDIAKNFGSGLVLVFERPIQVGDFVEVGEYSGTIERLGARSTMIRTLDNLDIFVPNSRFLEEEVINWSHRHSPTRTRVPVGVAYGSDLQQVEEALLEAAQSHKSVLKMPEPEVFFMGFGDSSLDFTLMVWIARPQQHVRIKSELNFKIDAAFRRRKIEIPFPQRDLHLRSGQLPIALERSDRRTSQAQENQPETPLEEGEGDRG